MAVFVGNLLSVVLVLFPDIFFKPLLTNFRMGTRGNAKKGKTQKEMDRWSKTEHDKPWTERRGY
jgi:hypothetical protein